MHSGLAFRIRKPRQMNLQGEPLSLSLLRNEMLVLVTSTRPMCISSDYAVETRLPHCFSGILVLLSLLHVNQPVSGGH